MKIIKRIIIAIAILGANHLIGQKTFVDGAPISVVDGALKTVTATIDNQNFDGIKLSDDGTKLFAYRELYKMIFVIDPVTNIITDTLNFANNVWDFVPGNASYLYYSENPTTFIYKLDLTTKQVVDSVSLNQGGSAYLRRRPGTNEIWTTKENQLHYFTLSNMTLTPIITGLPLNAWINTLEFNKTGSLAYFFAKEFNKIGELKKMDASTKSVTGVLTTPDDNGNLKYLTPSDDDSTLYINFWGKWPNEPSKIMLSNANTMSIYDSIFLPHKPFNMFEHPNGNELWVIYHYDAKIGVLDRTNNLAISDSLTVGTNPKNIVFTNASTAIHDFSKSSIDWNIYPNPTIGGITIQSEVEIKQISLIDLNGKLILTKQVKSKIHQLNISELMEGIYFLKIKTNKGIEIKKVIKQG